MTKKEIVARVATGAEWLDENITNWAKKIDHNKLAMRSDTDCIWGQLSAKAKVDPYIYLDELKSQDDMANFFHNHGFHGLGTEKELAIQTEAWKTEVAKRIDEAQATPKKKKTSKK